MEIRNKVILMTGVYSGIGKATAELFIRKGARLVLAAESAEQVKKLTAEIPDSLAVEVDMTKSQDIQKMVQQAQDYFGRIDVLINNTGMELKTPLDSASEDDFNRFMASDVYGPLVAMQSTIAMMKHEDRLAIVNISSGLLHLANSGVSAGKLEKNKNPLNTRTEYTSPGISISVVYPSGNVNTSSPAKNRKGIRSKRSILKHTNESTESIAEKIVDTIEKGIAVEFL